MSLRWSHMKIPIALSAMLLVMAALAGPVAAAGAGPQNLSAERAEGGIQLAWEAPSSDANSVTGYRIERMRPLQDEHAFTTLVSNTGNTDTAYLDTSPTVDNVDGDIYAYRVRALRDDDVSRSRRKDYASTTWYVPDSDPVEPPSTNPNFEERCQEDLTAGNAVACSSSMDSPASVRQDEGGAYEIDWSTWDAEPAQSDVTGYTVTRQRMMNWYFLRLKDGVWEPAGAGNVRTYLKPGTCEPGMSVDGVWRWECERSGDFNETPSGALTSLETLQNAANVTNQPGSLESQGRSYRRLVEIIKEPTPAPTGPDSMPVEVLEMVTANVTELHIYNIEVHRSTGASTTHTVVAAIVYERVDETN